MPTYDYRCDGCDHTFEEFQSFSDKPLKKCPECGKPKLQRLFGTGAGIIFKGSGFYQTDYRSESYKQAAKAEQSASSGKKEDAGSSSGNGASKGETAKTGEKSSKSET
jgi:putative FmdB family regulatory protein